MIDLLKNENKINKFFLAFALFIFVMILSLSFNAFYNGGDDYNFMMDLKDNGVFYNCFRGYFDWDGRFLTSGALIQAVTLLYLPIELTVLIWSFCFLFSGILIYYVVIEESNLEILKKDKHFFLLFLIPIIFWLGSFKHLSETVYWGTGGVYSYDLLIGAIWVLIFLKIEKVKINSIKKIAFIFFSFIVGASTENLTIALITLGLLSYIINFLKKQKTKNIVDFSILGLVLGLLFIALAPGNFLRLNALNQIASTDFFLFYIFKNYINCLLHYAYWTSILCFLSLIFSIATLLFIHLNLKISFKLNFYKLNNKENLIRFLKDFKWLFVALSTLVPFITIPEVVSSRTSIYFMFFMMIFVIVFSLNSFFKMSSAKNEFKTLKKNFVFTRFIFLVLLLLSSFFIFYNHYKGFHLKNEISKRELLLKNGKNKIVNLKLIDTKFNSPLYKFNDYIENGSETKKWIIESQERYFKTKISIAK